MCDDHGVNSSPADSSPGGITRRRFLTSAAGVATAAAVLESFPNRLALASPMRAQAASGESAYSMAMHIHSSFSEQSGSMDSQLYQAATNAVDVLWWTDHDHRMDGTDFRDVTHFTSFAEKGAAGQGGAWTWTVAQSGPNTSASGGGIVTNPCSPNDPVAGGALSLTAQTSGAAAASYGFYADSHPAAWNYRDNLTGQSILIDVLLNSGWSDGYLELLVNTSYHEAAGGNPAGEYTLSYQFTPGGQASSVAKGINGVITIPVTSPWQTCTITPSSDIANLWPDLDYRDFALWELTLSAVSTGDKVSGYFDYMRFDRTISGQTFFDQQAAMEAVLASQYPSVTQQQGLEVSLFLPHINWFGGNVTLPTYSSKITKGTYTGFVQETVIPAIHASGGLASYNHPYGYSDVAELSQSQQGALLTQVAGLLLPTAALGCDLIEVGYKLRQGVDVNHHIALWDVMSRNAIFLTGNGVSDDHFGTNWRGIRNNWVTSAWAASTAEADLLSALTAGRAWCGSISAYRGSLDLLVDGSVPMGAASVSSVASRSLKVIATGLSGGAKLQVLQGAVDYAGKGGLASNAQVIASYTTAQLAAGSVTLPVNTSNSSFIRTQVLSSAGAIIAASNPVWLLQAAPPGGIPLPRQA
jgi:hypothetical protein